MTIAGIAKKIALIDIARKIALADVGQKTPTNIDQKMSWPKKHDWSKSAKKHDWSMLAKKTSLDDVNQIKLDQHQLKSSLDRR